MKAKSLFLSLTLVLGLTFLSYGEPIPGLNLVIGAFNIQTLGPAKMGRPEFVSQVVKILSRYDIILIQEIRDVKENVMPVLTKELNNYVINTGIKYEYIISPRMGQSVGYKEQLAYLYRTTHQVILRSISVLYSYVAENPNLTYDRPPFVAKFKIQDPLLSLKEFVLMGVHFSPKNVFNESKELRDVTDRHLLLYDANENIAILGDFNFGCTFISSGNQDIVRRILNDFTWYINDKTATTISASNCSYDRVIINTNKFKSAVIPFSNNTYRYDLVYNLTKNQTVAISDHYPIELQLR